MATMTIAEYAAQIVAGWPPLDDLQKAELRRILAATEKPAKPKRQTVTPRRAAA